MTSRQLEHDHTSRRLCRSFSLSLRILCCSARSERRFSCTTDHIPTDLKGDLYPYVYVNMLYAIVKGSHNPLLETNELFFFLFSALKVNLDQSLKLHQVLLHPFTMYILQKQRFSASCT